MKEINAKEVIRLVKEAEKYSGEQINKVQNERLHELVDYVRIHSPYLSEKYKNLPKNFTLGDIPITERSEIVENFDIYVCDKDITSEKLQEYFSDTKNIGKNFLEKYTLMQTSGTTSAPLRIVRDERHQLIHGTLMASRYFGSSAIKNIEGLNDPFIRGCAIVPDSGFHSSYTSFVRSKNRYEENDKGDNLLLIPIFTPLNEMVKKLNEFQPMMIGTYPSIMRMLAYEQQAGRLSISPLFFASSAEKLVQKDREFVSKVFGCPVMDNYCSSEGGEIAMLCGEGHLHINSDWIIVEPITDKGEVVPAGTLSSGILITNLACAVEPIIRYRVSDTVIISDEPCPCGLPFPTIEICGRAEEVFEFCENERKVRLAATTLYLSAIEVDGCLSLQLIQNAPNKLTARIKTIDGYDCDAVATKIKKRINDMLRGADLFETDVCIEFGEPYLTHGGKTRCGFKDF